MQGRLFIIGTPIGNLADLSRRALDTLASLDILYCEDTRVTSKLLQHYNIAVKTRALSDDHGDERWAEAVTQVLDGRRVGYVSDAGMPGISDPGRRLSALAWESGVVPTVVPGPSAVDSLIAACPFIVTGYCFAGFAPRKAAERARFSERIVAATDPVLFFESPQRVHGLLDLLCAELEPERQLLLGRELTKLFEQLLLFRSEAWPALRESVPTRGEIVVAVAAAPSSEAPLDETAVSTVFQRLIEKGFSPRDAATATAAALDISANQVRRLTYVRRGE